MRSLFFWSAFFSLACIPLCCRPCVLSEYPLLSHFWVELDLCLSVITLALPCSPPKSPQVPHQCKGAQPPANGKLLHHLALLFRYHEKHSFSRWRTIFLFGSIGGQPVQSYMCKCGMQWLILLVPCLLVQSSGPCHHLSQSTLELRSMGCRDFPWTVFCSHGVKIFKIWIIKRKFSNLYCFLSLKMASHFLPDRNGKSVLISKEPLWKQRGNTTWPLKWLTWRITFWNNLFYVILPSITRSQLCHPLHAPGVQRHLPRPQSPSPLLHNHQTHSNQLRLVLSSSVILAVWPLYLTILRINILNVSVLARGWGSVWGN